jgi:aspartate racemase
MLATIRAIKAGGVTPAARVALAQASQDLLADGCIVQMIACTEFSLIADEVTPSAMAFDTLDQLVSGIIAFATDSGAGQDKAET